jgi:hypothetical protein
MVDQGDHPSPKTVITRGHQSVPHLREASDMH